MQKPVHPLPSNGWKRGDGMMMAHIEGPFHARMMKEGAVAWLGDAEQPRPTLWPLGFGVVFDPTELIGVDGETIAAEGDMIRSAGGYRSNKTGVQRYEEGTSNETLWIQGWVSLCRDVRHADRHEIPPDS